MMKEKAKIRQKKKICMGCHKKKNPTSHICGGNKKKLSDYLRKIRKMKRKCKRNKRKALRKRGGTKRGGMKK